MSRKVSTISTDTLKKAVHSSLFSVAVRYRGAETLGGNQHVTKVERRYCLQKSSAEHNLRILANWLQLVCMNKGTTEQLKL